MDLAGECRRDPLVGIEGEDPVVRREEVGEVLLIDVAGPARVSTRTPFDRAMATVSSVLPESTTMISSAQEALSMAAAMWSASLRVMMVTETFGTPESYWRNQESGT